MKKIVILGSTGSIGTQALQVVDFLKERLKVVGLVSKSNFSLMKEQIEKFKPEMVALEDATSAEALKAQVKNEKVKILSGQDGIIQVATIPQADLVLCGIVGIAGLIPAFAAIKAGKNVALANKESLVTAGSILMKAAFEAGVQIIPVDGEHGAIFQCLLAEKKCENIRKLILTASGGPFRNKSMDELRCVTLEQALKHPNWKMGKRITVDSATLMNKGFEVIEARWFFNVEFPKIEVIIHPESIVHSMVEFIDGSILAQLSTPDMRLQIQSALTYPERRESLIRPLNLAEVGQLNFQAPDMEKFPCLKYAYEAGEAGGTLPAVLNGADEVVVEAFLNQKVGFLDIPLIIKKTMEAHQIVSNPSLDDIIVADKWARNFTKNIITKTIFPF
jgi:1-deoxy-D-xylulose-5-phosphate reductoisomerase